MILRYIVYCISILQPAPPADHLQTVSKDSALLQRNRNPGDVRIKRGTRGPSGVTWQTAPTHKTFSFVYNDDSNQSEMMSPPVTGGVVLRSLRLDYQPPESVSPDPEPSVSLNNSTRLCTPKMQPPLEKRGVAPTVEILRDCWRKEDEQEKAIRILRWILNEQAQRIGGMDCQSLN